MSMKPNHSRIMWRGIMPMALLLILLVLLIAPASGRDEKDGNHVEQAAQVETPGHAIERLQNDSGGRAIVSHNTATGVASFVRLPRAEDGGPVLTAGLSAEAEAWAFLETYGAVFGVADPDSQLQLVDRRANVAGQTLLSYKQVHEGVDVFAGMLRVHLDGNNRVTSANGAFIPGIKVDTTPGVTSEAAVARAVAHVQAQAGGQDASELLAAVNSKLYLFREGLVRRVAGDVRLVYEVEVTNPDITVREFVYVDAHSGRIVDQITGIYNDLDRKVSEVTLANVVWEDSESDPDPIPAGWAGGDAQQVIDWQDEIDGARESYNLFYSMAARDSYDGLGATMRTVNNDPNISCPNANWNGTSTNYCTGVTADDVVAHEWGHAYTQFTNDLIYQWQSGALNESYSDIWGETVDLLNGRGTDAPGVARTAGSCSMYGAGMPQTDDSYRWLMGEDATAFALPIRDMWNPVCNGHPGKVSDVDQYECTTFDNGGVHINSGIPNHAYALMVDGGTYNGVTVTGMGLTKAAHIHWEAQNMLTMSSNFVDHADALEAACTNLIGVDLPALSTSDSEPGPSGEMIDEDDCQEVADAIAAVELRTEPAFCGFEPLLEADAPPLCEGLGDVESIFFENWEGGELPDGWAVGTHDVANPATFDTPNWDVVGGLPAGAKGDYAAFAADLITGDCALDDETGAVYLDSPLITVPDGASVPRVAFDHWVATELGWDGGNVKVSVNGADWTLLPSSAFEFNPYNESLTTSGGGNTNPLAGEPAFTGSDGGTVSGSWGQSQVNLLGIAEPGDEVQFRFDFGVDGCNGLVGWYVDDVEVYSCSEELGPAAIEANPAGLTETVAVEKTSSDALTIHNTGESDLEWQIEEETPSSVLLGARGNALVETVAPADASQAAALYAAETSFSTEGLSAPAASVSPAAVPPGVTTITHSASQDIVDGNSVWCGAAPGNSYLRVFDLVNDFDITSTFDVTEVEFGVQVAVAAGGEQPATVNLYTLDGPFLYANLTEIGTADTTIVDQVLSTVTVPVTGTVAPGEVLVVEVYVPANNVTAGFLIGSNPAGQTASSYLVGIACGISEPTPTENIGFPDMHVVMNVTGEVGDDFLPCTNPSDVPWLSVSPQSGITPGGSSSEVTVSYDATGLTAGNYEARLCVSSNAFEDPVRSVPVDLTVIDEWARYLPVIFRP